MPFLKTILISTAAAGTIGFGVFGTRLVSIFDTAYAKTAEAAGEVIPMDFELDMVERQIGKAGEDLDAQRSRIAELEVGCQDLQLELGELERNGGVKRQRLESLTDAYEATGLGARPAVFGGRTVRPEKLQSELQLTAMQVREFDRMIQLKKQLLDKRQDVLDRARSVLAEMTNAEHELTIQLESRRVDLETARLLAEPLGSDVSSGNLAEARSMLENVGHRIRVARAKAEYGVEGAVALTDKEVLGSRDAYHEAVILLGRDPHTPGGGGLR